jgi:hypothetical protein
VFKQAMIADANGSALASKKCRRGCGRAPSDRMLQRIFRCLLLVIFNPSRLFLNLPAKH